jgi:hypothetical protein
MKKQTKQKRSKSKKSDKEQIDAGAEEIRQAKKEAKAAKEKRTKKKTEAALLEPVVIPASTRPIQEILADHVTVLPGHIGLKLSDDTPIEESLRILDWTTTLSDHVGFLIGDVINYGDTKWGEKYAAALNQTGRAYTTLVTYARTAKKIPIESREAALSFSLHVEAAK